VTALEWVAVAFGVVSVLLTVRQNAWCWPLGIVNVGLFALLFWRERLYADAGLQLVYVAVCAYGWWAWLRGGPGAGALRVSRTPRRVSILLFVAGAVLAAVLGLTLKRATDASLPFWDAGTTAFSLVAQWMQARKWLENWLVWIVVDVVYVGMYVQKGLVLTAFLYAGFIALALLGAFEWRRALHAGGEGR
jgi:nicotinamide mononucleotide transporter